jgi:hypothetical protein
MGKRRQILEIKSLVGRGGNEKHRAARLLNERHQIQPSRK